MSKDMVYKGRSEAIHFSQILTPIWDLVPMNLWERYVYVELCSWSGINEEGSWIRFSALTLARKYRLSDPKLKENTVRINIYHAIVSLEEKGVLKTKHGENNQKEVFLTDIKLCIERKWYANVTQKKRGKLYRKYD
jgi:hypothetical protein